MCTSHFSIIFIIGCYYGSIFHNDFHDNLCFLNVLILPLSPRFVPAPSGRCSARKFSFTRSNLPFRSTGTLLKRRKFRPDMPDCPITGILACLAGLTCWFNFCFGEFPEEFAVLFCDLLHTAITVLCIINSGGGSGQEIWFFILHTPNIRPGLNGLSRIILPGCYIRLTIG